MTGTQPPHRGLQRGLVAMSGCAVLSDAMLVACYPQFFARRFGVTSALHVGAYLAAISIVVMCALPLWARLARRVETMHLLPATQCAAGVLCLMGATASGVTTYWVLSLAMFACKSSYLLMYPYLMRLQPDDARGDAIGLLSVLVNLGGIAGAVTGGWLLQEVGPQACLVLMAAGDFAQMGLGLWLLASRRAVLTHTPPTAARPVPPAPPRGGAERTLRELCALVLLVDFSAYVAGPFFSVHWEHLAPAAMSGWSSVVYAVPGAVALAALCANRHHGAVRDRVGAHLLLGAAGMLLQALPHPAAILAGRALFGWALFQLVVQLEGQLFSRSTPASYARDFSRFNFFQQLGALLSSLAAGAMVQRMGTEATFLAGAAGFTATAALHRAQQARTRTAAPTPVAGDLHVG